MPVSRRRIKKRGRTLSQTQKAALTHNGSLLLHYAQATERHYAAYVQEFKRAVTTRSASSDVRQAFSIIGRVQRHRDEVVYWMETAPEAAWLREDGELSAREEEA